MQTFNETTYPTAAAFQRIEPIRPFFSIAVKGTFALTPDGKCVALPKERQSKLEMAIDYLDPIGNSRRTDRDTTPFKPHADCLFLGSAWAPNGEPVEAMDAVFAVGAMRKTLWVYGDRAWAMGADGQLSVEGPAPFAEMPIRNEFAHGGLTSKFNKHGRGLGTAPELPGDRLPMANLVDPDNRAVRWDEDTLPAGFGVLAPQFSPRRDYMGTFDQAWLYSRKPLPPADFDPAFFNGARPDQQIEDYLRGDEELYFKNLHPKHAEYNSQLPGTRVRIFAHHFAHDGSGEREFVEVLTNLDTCIVDMPAETVTLIWRGTIHSVKEDKLGHVPEILIVEEALDTPADRHDYHKLMQRRMAEANPPPPSDEPTEEEKAAMAEIDEKGLVEIVKTLKEGGADQALIDQVAKQKTVEDAMNVLSDAAKAFQEILPNAPS